MIIEEIASGASLLISWPAPLTICKVAWGSNSFNFFDAFRLALSFSPHKTVTGQVIFVFQGAAPEKWMLEAGDYTMKRFAGLYGMTYGGMVTNKNEATKLGKNI